jgi:hypothetical protein
MVNPSVFNQNASKLAQLFFRGGGWRVEAFTALSFDVRVLRCLSVGDHGPSARLLTILPPERLIFCFTRFASARLSSPKLAPLMPDSSFLSPEAFPRQAYSAASLLVNLGMVGPNMD